MSLPEKVFAAGKLMRSDTEHQVTSCKIKTLYFLKFRYRIYGAETASHVIFFIKPSFLIIASRLSNMA